MLNIKNKKRFIGYSLLTVCGITLLGLVASNINFSPSFLFARADRSADYSLTLDSSNKVTTAGDHTQKTKRGNDVRFTYANVVSSTSGHVTLNNSGYLVNKDHIRSIQAFTCNLSGAGTLKFKISYDGATWNEATTVVSDYKFDIGTSPYYIHFAASNGSVTVNSLKIEYSCTQNSAAHEGETPEEVSDSATITGAKIYDAGLTVSNSAPATGNYTVDGISYHVTNAYTYYLNSNSTRYISFGKNNAGEIHNVTPFEGRISSISVSYRTGSSASPEGNLKLSTNGSTWVSYSESVALSGDYHYFKLDYENITLSQYTNFDTVTISLLKPGSFDYDTPSNPTYVVGFEANDDSKNTYHTANVYDTDNTLVVKSIDANGNKTTLSKGGSEGYSYTITNSSDVVIDSSKAFGTEGVYTLTVSYKNFIPVEITLLVGEYVYVTDVSAAMAVTTFNTSDTLSTYLGANLTATLEYSNNTISSSISYAEFAANAIGVKLLNPKGISYQITNPFGTAGTWTLKVYDMADENMYYNISLTVNAIPVDSVTVSGGETELTVDDTLQLTATIKPDDATNNSVVWSSSNENVATVDENGLVTAVGVGSATITAIAADGSNKYGDYTITVAAKPATVSDVITRETTGVSSGSTTYTDWSGKVGASGAVYAGQSAGGNNSIQLRTKNSNSGIVTTTSGGRIAKVVVAWNSSTSGRTLDIYAKSSAYSDPTDLYGSSSGTKVGSIASDSATELVIEGDYEYVGVRSNDGALYMDSITFVWGDLTPVTPVYPTSISLSGDKSSISIGETAQLTVGYLPIDTNVKNVTYSSSNENVATVSATGLVTGVIQGSVTITATAQKESGTTSATFGITVTPIAVTSISLSSNSETLKVGKTVTLVATVNPSNATNPNLKWKTSSTAIATVSGGVVTGVAEGTATITAFSDTDNDNVLDSGEKSATCTVVVQSSSAGGEETFSITYTDLPSTYQTGSTVYTAASGIKFQAYNCANYSSKMQWRASSGYLQSTEELELQSITINDRESNTLTVYGSNTAGSFSNEITGSNDVYDLTGYSYFKIARTASGAAYCSSITVVTGTPTPTDPTSIIMSPTSAEVAVGGSKQLSVSYVPSNANQNKEVTWTSSNTNVATVSSDGLISVKSTASAGQTATITARLTNITSIYATCTITVVEQSKDDHTVLIYMCGADLESENQLATGDIQEILKISGQPDDVNIVLETGGANSWASTYGISSTYLERYHVENKSLVRDNQLTYASMGLTSTLQSFIEYGLNNYPAERTGLVFWNHGGGMRGVCYDEKKNDDVLKNSEIRSAVSGALSNCGMSGQKLEWVGYDACLMAVQDIAETNSDYFNYMIASEESEAGYGWDYDTWVDDLYSKKTTTTILKAIVDGFISDNGGANSSSGDQTLSYLDLSKASAYKTAWENMAAQLNSVVTNSNKSSFNSAITSNVKHYADSDYDYFCTFDAWDFVDKLANNSAFSSFRIDSSYTTAVKNAHANLVAYNLAQKGAGVSKGICMYWPNSTKYSDVSTYYTTSETRFTTWRSFCVNKGTHA